MKAGGSGFPRANASKNPTSFTGGNEFSNERRPGADGSAARKREPRVRGVGIETPEVYSAHGTGAPSRPSTAAGADFHLPPGVIVACGRPKPPARRRAAARPAGSLGQAALLLPPVTP